MILRSHLDMVFHEISKATDKVWHNGPIFKLRQYEVTGKTPNILTDLLKARKQQIFLNGQYSQ